MSCFIFAQKTERSLAVTVCPGLNTTSRIRSEISCASITFAGGGPCGSELPTPCMGGTKTLTLSQSSSTPELPVLVNSETAITCVWK